MTVGIASLDHEVTALNKADIGKPLLYTPQCLSIGTFRSDPEIANTHPLIRLGKHHAKRCGLWPCRCGAAEQRDELAPVHSIEMHLWPPAVNLRRQHIAFSEGRVRDPLQCDVRDQRCSSSSDSSAREQRRGALRGCPSIAGRESHRPATQRSVRAKKPPLTVLLRLPAHQGLLTLALLPVSDPPKDNRSSVGR